MDERCPRRIAIGLVGCIVTACTSPAEPSAPLATTVESARVSDPAPSLILDPGAVGSPDGADLLYPGLGNGGYDVTRYRVRLGADPVTNDADIEVAIDAVANQPLARFNLDYSGIAVRGVTVDGRPAAWESNGEELVVTPDARLERGGRYAVVVSILGQPSPMDPPSAGWRWTPGEQISAFGLYDAPASWLPHNADPADKAIIEFDVTVPRPYVAVAPGVLEGVDDVGDRRRYRWRSGPTSGFSLTIREYEVLDLGVASGVRLAAYIPRDLPDVQRAALDALPMALELLVDRYGPYPFAGLNLVWVGDHTDRRGPDEGLLYWGVRRRTPRDFAHHLTHLWFQVNVTPRTSKESYLRSAFANYGDLLWVEAQDPPDQLGRLLALWYRELGAETDAPADPQTLVGNRALFLRGPLSLHALRLRLGDEVFFQILRTWVVRHARGAATVDDFVALAEDVAGRSLQSWADAWLRSRTVPPATEVGLSAP